MMCSDVVPVQVSMQMRFMTLLQYHGLRASPHELIAVAQQIVNAAL